MPTVLLVGHALPPSRRPCARRIVRLGTHLQRLGWQITALSMAPRYTEPNDRGAVAEPPFECLRTQAGVAAAWLRQGSVAQRVVRRLAIATSFPDEFVGWLPFALAAVRERRFDVVLASMPWFTTGLVGAAVAAQTGARLVLDYRDPWTDLLELEAPLAGWRRSSHASLEAAILARSALVTAMTPTLASWLTRRSGRMVEVMPNAIDSVPPARVATKSGPLRIAHAGSLAYGRSLAPVLAAMAATRGVLQRPVQLVHAGPHASSVQADARKFGVLDLVHITGEIDQAAAEALVHDADLAVACVSDAYAYATPGKLFQIAGRTPLLLIGPVQADAACLVRRHQLGWTCDRADRAGIAQALVAAAGGEWPQPVGLDELTYATVATRYEALLRALL